jgi:ABC-type transporter Mla maintaining outer membrane lipid asymmetry permease subunit MlaE
MYFASAISPLYYLNFVTQLVTPSFLIILIAKYTVLPLCVFIIACQLGLSVKRSSYEVPQASSKAVLRAVFTVMVLHVGLTLVQLLYSQSGAVL